MNLQDKLSALEIQFKVNTVCKKTKYGYEIRCKEGLWSVCAPTKAKAEQEAQHYFWQYYSDGEYE